MQDPNRSLIASLVGRLLALPLRLKGKSALPVTDGCVRVQGTSAPVEIIRDRWGIVHIQGANLEDTFFGHGYAQAQDRMWQMELSRRVSSGRLAEMVGEAALGTDRLSRVLGLRRAAARELPRLADRSRALLEAFARGVNAYLGAQARSFALELDLLGVTPEPWHPVDTLAIGRLESWVLSHAWAGELVRAQLVDRLGAERAADLERLYGLKEPVIVSDEALRELIGKIAAAARVADGGAAGAQPGTPMPILPHAGAIGSNSWTLAPTRTTTGGAMLANDMHFELRLPNIWHLAHLRAMDGSFHATGCGIPGVPGVLVGHNEDIAWGATLAFTDQQDLVVERFVAGAGAARRYETESGPREAEVIREEIRVKGRAAPVIEDVVVTRNGPIVGPALGLTLPLALRSVPLESRGPLEGVLRLSVARDWDSFVAAASTMPAPPLNLVYADRKGNVGYCLVGQVPIRSSGRGAVPQPGWTGEGAWVGWVPWHEMPRVLNPPEGFCVTANNKVVGDSYPYYLTDAAMNGYRAERIRRVILEKGRLGADDCQRLQMDTDSIAGRELVSRLSGLTPESADQRLALEMLHSWNGSLAAGSREACVYQALLWRLEHVLLESVLGHDLFLSYMGCGPHPVLMPASELFGRASVVVLGMLDQPGTPWLTAHGGREAVLRRCLGEAIALLRERMGPDPATWNWGRLHRMFILHAFTASPVLGPVFDRGPYPTGGDTDTVDQSAFRPEVPFEAIGYAPSYRHVVDMADLTRSRVMMPGGQSGHLASPHYDDLIRPFLAGEMVPMLWDQKDVVAAAAHTLVLEPAIATAAGKPRS